MAKTVLVTGATGVIGPALIGRLLNKGYQVRALVRNRAKATQLLPTNVTLIAGDICDLACITEAMTGVDIVCHLAAKLHINDPSPTLRDLYWATNVEATENLVASAVSHQVERFLFYSTINVYGPTRQEHPPLDENAPLRPDTLYGESKVAAENFVRKAKNKQGEPIGVILRVSAVYGPQMKGNYPRLINAIRRNIFAPIGDGENRRTLIFEADIVEATLCAIQSPEALGETYNATDGQIHTLKEILEAIHAIFGKRYPRWYIPTRLVKTAVALIALPFNLSGKKAPISPQMVDKLTEDVAISGEKLAKIGYTPQYNLAQGWAKTIQSTIGQGK